LIARLAASAAVEVVNRQRNLRIDSRHWAAFGQRALEEIQRATRSSNPHVGEGGATIAFVSDRAIRRLNREHLGKDAVTDVLSFPAEPEEFERVAAAQSLGDIVIAVPQATRQAAEHNLSLDQEIAQLILHGLLHLRGYDHATDAGEMNRLELRLRRRLDID